MTREMPEINASPVEFVGPFERHDVVVDGWSVPLLEAEPLPGGRVTLSIDRRFALTMSLSESERFIPFLAQAIAVALGFPCHPSGDDEKPKGLPLVRPRRMVSLDLDD